MSKSDQTSSKKPPVPPVDDLAAKVAAAAAGDKRTTDLEKKIVELEKQLKEAREVASRAQAELQNAKARLDREALEIRSFASQSVLLKFLPTIDNLQRALKHLPQDLAGNDWVKGIVALEQGFLKQVGEMGLKRFESVGQPVDAARHEVLMQGPGEAGVVTDVIEDGYELHGKVVRVAKVKVGGGA
jgi:molecular chaperone GrpE